jgi:multisubunit Na+/H+ antiporter MnhB subunit
MHFREEKGMGIIVKTVTKLTLGFILLYGIYIALSGHISPGGGFAGGVIIALSFIHIMLAFGKEVALKRLRPAVLRFIIGMGALVFLGVVMVRAESLIFKDEIIIPLCEAAIVGGGLFSIFIALVLLSKIDKDSE